MAIGWPTWRRGGHGPACERHLACCKEREARGRHRTTSPLSWRLNADAHAFALGRNAPLIHLAECSTKARTTAWVSASGLDGAYKWTLGRNLLVWDMCVLQSGNRRDAERPPQCRTSRGPVEVRFVRLAEADVTSNTRAYHPRREPSPSTTSGQARWPWPAAGLHTEGAGRRMIGLIAKLD